MKSTTFQIITDIVVLRAKIPILKKRLPIDGVLDILSFAQTISIIVSYSS